MIPRPQPVARLRLIGFPHAGGGASSFFSWGAGLADFGIEMRAVQYPGRETRFSEACISDAALLVRAIVDHWEEIAGAGPVALFGHSMGAVLAYEVAAELARQSAGFQPVRLFVSGHQAPALPYRAPQLRAVADAELVPAVARHFGGIPAELQDNPDIAEVIRPILRADLTLVETYRWRAAPRLTLPISAWGGLGDPWATEPELQAWSEYTSSGFVLRRYPGDHFFLQQNREHLWADVAGDLGS